jgi:hypothetical protein
LANIKSTAYSPAVCLPRLCVHQPLLGLDDRTRLALVINTKDLAPDLELAAFAGDRNRLEEFKLALTIKDMLGVKLGYTIDGFGVRAGVKVDYFLVRVLEWQDDGICREGSELRVQLLQ